MMVMTASSLLKRKRKKRMKKYSGQTMRMGRERLVDECEGTVNNTMRSLQMCPSCQFPFAHHVDYIVGNERFSTHEQLAAGYRKLQLAWEEALQANH